MQNLPWFMQVISSYFQTAAAGSARSRPAEKQDRQPRGGGTRSGPRGAESCQGLRRSADSNEITSPSGYRFPHRFQKQSRHRPLRSASGSMNLAFISGTHLRRRSGMALRFLHVWTSFFIHLSPRRGLSSFHRVTLFRRAIFLFPEDDSRKDDFLWRAS